MRDHLGFEFNEEISSDFFRVVTGKLLGTGQSRRVYECALNTNLVVKVENPRWSFDNILEYDLWNEVRRDRNLRKWFAECHNISPCGRILIQDRTFMTDRFPQKIPVWFTDLHYQNFGRLRNGRFVCHDYAGHKATALGLKPMKMKKADWRLEKNI